ncbi:MAG: protein BatD [Desulfatibacillum sp.]|nr:protein BatD [Desulfatibacillum sp.]
MNKLTGHIPKITRIIPVLMGLLFLAAPALSAQISVTLEAAPNRVQVDDVFRLTVKVTGATSIDDIRIAGTDGFELGNPRTGSQTSIANGTITRSVEYSYGISPHKQGVYTLGPATVTEDGKTYTSNTVRVQVDPVEEIRGREQDSMFLTAEVLPQQAYPGQEIVCRIRFYWNAPLGNIQFEGFPDIENLEFTQIGDSRQFQKNINGKTFNVAELLHAVTPSVTGDFELPPLSVKAEVIKANRRPSRFPRGWMDDSMFGNEERIKTRVLSEPASFTVKPLPTDGQPRDFNGLLGQFSAAATLEPKQVKAGDSATLTVTLSGRGNTQLMPDLKLPPIPGVKIYPSEPQFAETRDGQGLFGKKTMQWALVPQVEGEISIPQFSVPFFNAASGQYENAATREMKLKVLPGELPAVLPAATEMQVATSAKRKVQMLGEDILKIHESPQAVSPAMGQTMPLWLVVLILGFPALPVAGAIVLRRLSKTRSDQAAARASKKAFGAFSKAIKDLEPNQAAEAFKALQEYLALRLGLEGATLTSHEAEEKLLALGVDAAAVSRLTQIFSRLETCVFSQCSQEFSQETKQDLFSALRVIDKKVKL